MKETEQLQSSSTEKKYLPMLYDISNKNILMIGAGLACREKLKTLAQTKKQITVLSSSFHTDFLNKDWLILKEKKYQAQDLQDFDIIYVGVNHPETEKQIQKDIDKLERPILVNFLSSPQNSNFISVSTLTYENFCLCISSYGKAPATVKKIREQLEQEIDFKRINQFAKETVLQRNKKK